MSEYVAEGVFAVLMLIRLQGLIYADAVLLWPYEELTSISAR